MFFPCRSLPKGFILVLFVNFYLIELSSQCIPFGIQTTVQCNDAPLTCMSDACYATSNVADLGWNGFCGNNTVIHNLQFFEIIPIKESIEIHIQVNTCDQGFTALQAALVTSCNWVPCPGGKRTL